ncbi:hypothetical protein [Flavobacterium difficile]|uniref:Uncharacterized protein n=1 Tax=Flavobacterium difficile TaxID=2709659 RepID=A0ABX0IBS9_9FLAO|nr:hypothetical protein [Flavobacterium difficile]NHM02836.1 hypothetical protein [Flavobacterium difficile]
MKLINKSIKIIYYSIFTIILVFVIVSVASYLNVYLRYGEVPSSIDFTQEFVDSGKQFNIFPEKAGTIIMLAYLLTIAISLGFVPLLFILNFFNNNINPYKKLALILITINIFVYIQFCCFSYMNWYFGYVLD